MNAVRYAVAHGVLHRLVGDEVFVLMPDGRIHWLREATAQTLWLALAAPEAPPDVSALTGRLTGEFDVAPAQAEADVRAFVERLVREGVLVALPA
jgi:hypothetical protein